MRLLSLTSTRYGQCRASNEVDRAAQAKIDEHKRELNAERSRAQREKDEEAARKISDEAAMDKDKALRDARLAGELDDRADEGSLEKRRAEREERQSLLQLKQLHDEVQPAVRRSPLLLVR